MCRLIAAGALALMASLSDADEPLPDLVPDPLIVRDVPGYGQACILRLPTVEACVANEGAAAAGPFSVAYGFSGSGSYVTDFLRLDGLDAGQHLCQQVYLPNDAPLNIVVDSHNEVAESNEDNNRRYDIIGYATLPPTCSPGPPGTATTTPSPPPTNSPPPPSPTTPEATPIPPLCIGDCNDDHAVTVDELVTGVLMALGTISSDTCEAFCLTGCGPGPALRRPDVACLVRAVNFALGVCPSRCLTDDDCNPSNDCALRSCTPSGCVYECLCL